MTLGGDLQTDMKLDGGIIKCHSTTDLVLTPSGDLDLVTGDGDAMRQRLLIWLAVPQGELFDPYAGCPVYDYFHTKLSQDNLTSMSRAMLTSFQYLFPELGVYKVELTKTDYTTLFCEVYAGDSALGFLFSKQDIDTVNKNMWADWANNNLVPFATEE